MNDWRSRLYVAIILIAVMQFHSIITESWDNTLFLMTMFHGSAATFDLLILYSVSKLISGRLRDDMQTLCLVSIVINFIGWIAYLAYAPPVFYNITMWGLTYVQFGRLLYVDDHDVDSLGCHLVSSPNFLGKKSYY